jgi:hypothetical protein
MGCQREPLPVPTRLERAVSTLFAWLATPTGRSVRGTFLNTGACGEALPHVGVIRRRAQRGAHRECLPGGRIEFVDRLLSVSHAPSVSRKPSSRGVTSRPLPTPSPRRVLPTPAKGQRVAHLGKRRSSLYHQRARQARRDRPREDSSSTRSRDIPEHWRSRDTPRSGASIPSRRVFAH